MPAAVVNGVVLVSLDAVVGGALPTPAGSPTVALSLPCGVASGARLASFATSTARVAASSWFGVAVPVLAGVAEAFGAVVAVGLGVGAETFAIVVGALMDGCNVAGWVAGARADWSRSIRVDGTGVAGVGEGSTVAGATWISVAPRVIAGACGCGSSVGVVSAGADTGVCCMTIGAGCAGSGNGCTRGTSGAAGGCGTGATLTGATAFGISTCMAMAGRLSGAGVVTFGNASELGDRIGRLPSACGARTGSGWNFGGTGGTGVGSCTASAGGSPAGDTGFGSGNGAGAGRLTGGGGVASGLGMGARVCRLCAAAAGAGIGAGAVTASVLALASVEGVGGLRRP